MRKTIAEYEAEGYEGADMSLEVSLLQQGLIWKDDGLTVNFIYGVDQEEEGVYSEFASASIPKDIDPEQYFKGIDFDAVAHTADLSREELLKQDLCILVWDLNSYYSHVKIFGEQGKTFGICKYRRKKCN